MAIVNVFRICSLYEYVNETFIPSLRAIQWYHRYYQMEPGLMVDYNTKILGVGRLRQHRVTQDSCAIPYQAYGLNMSCTREFSLSAAAYGEYDQCWERKLLEVEYNRLIDIWKYKYDGQAVYGKICYTKIEKIAQRLHNKLP